MRSKTYLLIFLAVFLLIGADGARDRKKNKNRNRDNESGAEGEEQGTRAGSFFGGQDEERRKETKDRERLMEKKEREKEEESSEEKDEKEKNGTSSEIEIPKRRRRNLELSRAKELNDGSVQSLDKKSGHEHPKHQHRIRRWPSAMKKEHMDKPMHRKRKAGRKTIKHKQAARIRRAKKLEPTLDENVEDEMKTKKSKVSSSSSESNEGTRKARSFRTSHHRHRRDYFR
ncbi:hypothetical protein RB195_026181 [Necator americanus]|uniref:Uncharacterized protein n=1 Tax=Necator americanus TaxID=51031 RepID=A0ABR1EVR7_NECAM